MEDSSVQDTSCQSEVPTQSNLSPSKWKRIAISTHARRKFIYECLECKSEVVDIPRHMRSSHTKERPYSCLTCEQKFFESGPCVSHIRNVHPDVKNIRYQVQFPGQEAYINKVQTRSKVKIHKRKAPYSFKNCLCVTCEKSFAHPARCVTHILLKHPDSQTPSYAIKKPRGVMDVKFVEKKIMSDSKVKKEPDLEVMQPAIKQEPMSPPLTCRGAEEFCADQSRLDFETLLNEQFPLTEPID